MSVSDFDFADSLIFYVSIPLFYMPTIAAYSTSMRSSTRTDGNSTVVVVGPFGHMRHGDHSATSKLCPGRVLSMHGVATQVCNAGLLQYSYVSFKHGPIWLVWLKVAKQSHLIAPSIMLSRDTHRQHDTLPRFVVHYDGSMYLPTTCGPTNEAQFQDIYVCVFAASKKEVWYRPFPFQVCI